MVLCIYQVFSPAAPDTQAVRCCGTKHGYHHSTLNTDEIFTFKQVIIKGRISR